jgi:opacity protein-like surface antigen
VKITIAFSALLCAVAMATPASAQAPDDPPALARLLFVVSEQSFSARKTFETVFGKSRQPFWGGGLSVAFRNGFYVDVIASRFRKTGERAFFSDGQGYRLGIPLTVTVTPLEVTAGGRFRVTPRVFPYVGAGVGSYRYQETSEFDDGPLDMRHVGYLVVGGVELRLSRWVAVSGDAQYTRVSGIIGSGGISKDAGESDLGGTAGRFRVIVGR